MKVRISKTSLIVLFLALGLIFLSTSQAIAQTQGDVAIKLAALLGMDSSSTDKAVANLTSAGIILPGGWNTGVPADEAFIKALYNAVNDAIKTKKIVPPQNLANASALVAAAAVAAEIPSLIVVNAIIAAEGNKDQGTAGASFGISWSTIAIGYILYDSSGGGGGIKPIKPATPSR